MIAREYGLSRATVYRRLQEAGLTHTEGGTYTTRQVNEAIFSSYTAERTKLVRAQKEQAELLLAQMRGEDRTVRHGYGPGWRREIYNAAGKKVR
jgi:hypothetical protein